MSECKHDWRDTGPDNGYSGGDTIVCYDERCKKCGAERTVQVDTQTGKRVQERTE